MSSYIPQPTVYTGFDGRTHYGVSPVAAYASMSAKDKESLCDILKDTARLSIVALPLIIGGVSALGGDPIDCSVDEPCGCKVGRPTLIMGIISMTFSTLNMGWDCCCRGLSGRRFRVILSGVMFLTSNLLFPIHFATCHTTPPVE